MYGIIYVKADIVVHVICIVSSHCRYDAFHFGKCIDGNAYYGNYYVTVRINVHMQSKLVTYL